MADTKARKIVASLTMRVEGVVPRQRRFEARSQFGKARFNSTSPKKDVKFVLTPCFYVFIFFDFITSIMAK